MNTVEIRDPHARASTLGIVRPLVRDLLQRSPAYARLAPPEQRRLANQMVQVATYLADPEGVVSEARNGPGPLVRAQEDDPVTATQRRLSQRPGSTGADFEAGAVNAGVQAFGEMVKKVDFPAFVAGLIHGVFEAIVDSSIRQMQAYGELIANVAKSVGEFAQDNVTENNARDWLVSQFPDDLEISTSSMSGGLAADGETVEEHPVVQPKEGVDEDAIAQKLANLLPGLGNQALDLSEPAQEAKVLYEARLAMAKSRQQLLSSMVLLGINRIVVTDGQIHAKVVFDMKASDQAKRVARASMADLKSNSTRAEMHSGHSAWFSPVSAGASASTASDHRTTVESSVDDTSESKAAVKANLTGEVKVNFKSDYLPMEKMATPEMIAAITGNAEPVGRASAAAAAPAATP